MKYILLCGGIGKRCNNYSLPKPLNYINGKHMIEYIIENIPNDIIYIIYNIYLKEYNFEEIIINLFKNKKIYFSCIDYLTRGPVETAYIGIKQFNFNEEEILFIDNDIINIFPKLDHINDNFICYSKNYDKTNYSFIMIDNNNKIINIEEKNKISDDYCCGIYGFKNSYIFNKYANILFETNYKIKNEFYFSQLYKLIINNNETIIPVFIENTNHIGTYDDILLNSNKKNMRICFDLDNTLVSYPTVPYDYTTVKPITNMINILNKLKDEGHHIIIHTARRMKTHNNNIGLVIKDIALITINTLEKFNIKYDELIFGKPYADIYIDDKSINPYINNISYFGFFNNNTKFIHNKIKNNKYNKIEKKDNIIIKNGKYNFIKGEIFFYKNIPNEIIDLFPKLIKYNDDLNDPYIHIEYINGIPLYFLYKNNLITKKIIDDLFNILEKIHSINNNIIITDDNIYNNYIIKVKNRFNNIDYFFDDSIEIFNKIIDIFEKNYAPEITSTIHGDFWFSNILLDYNDNYKLIDMKGQVDNILTLNGDIYYDYAKLYQSILGFDLVLNDNEFDEIYMLSIKEYFLEKCTEKKLNIDYLNAVTILNIFGSMHSFENDEIKINMWKFIKKLI
jgi:hypothetical protein